MASNKKVLISIITVVLNAAKDIRQTIESVIPHLADDVEYIIVDGGSTDGTVEVIESYAGVIAKWKTETDSGIYDAMNRALSLCKGKFVLHLNVGDGLIYLPRDILARVADDVACLAFPVLLSDNRVFRPSAGLGLNFHNTIHHQGGFYRRALIESYDLRYRVFSDFDLNLRLRRKGFSILIGKEIVSYHDLSGVSNTTTRFDEVYSIVRNHGGVLWVVVAFVYFKLQGLIGRLKRTAV